MIHTFELFPGVTLRCYPDHRFKHGCLSVQLVRPMRREEAASNALLPAVLPAGIRNGFLLSGGRLALPCVRF